MEMLKQSERQEPSGARSKGKSKRRGKAKPSSPASLNLKPKPDPALQKMGKQQQQRRPPTSSFAPAQPSRSFWSDMYQPPVVEPTIVESNVSVRAKSKHPTSRHLLDANQSVVAPSMPIGESEAQQAIGQRRGFRRWLSFLSFLVASSGAGALRLV